MSGEREPCSTIPGAGGLGGHTCVIADDMALMREVVQLRIEELGMRVIGVAEDGPSAVRMTVEQSPDLLVVDFNMAGMDGLAVIRRLVEIGSPARMLLYTADPRAQLIELAREAGAHGCLNKSSGHAAWRTAIDTIMQGGTSSDPDDAMTHPMPLPLRLAIKPVDLAQAAHLADKL